MSLTPKIQPVQFKVGGAIFGLILVIAGIGGGIYYVTTTKGNSTQATTTSSISTTTTAGYDHLGTKCKNF